jgi:hypothetical protein
MTKAIKIKDIYSNSQLKEKMKAYHNLLNIFKVPNCPLQQKAILSTWVINCFLQSSKHRRTQSGCHLRNILSHRRTSSRKVLLFSHRPTWQLHFIRKKRTYEIEAIWNWCMWNHNRICYKTGVVPKWARPC